MPWSANVMTAAPAHPALPELGFYTLAGQPESSRDILGEVRNAEALGLGTASPGSCAGCSGAR